MVTERNLTLHTVGHLRVADTANVEDCSIPNKPRHTEGHEEEVGQGAIPDGDLNLIKATVIICHKHLFQYVM